MTLLSWAGIASVAFIIGALVLAEPLAAATYTTACPPADASCLALAERLEAQVAASEANGAKLDTANGKLDQLHADLTAPASEPSEVSGTVALAEGDAARLDMLAGAAFLFPGVFFGLWLGRRFWGEMGRW